MLWGVYYAWQFKKLYTEIETNKKNYSPNEITYIDDFCIEAIDGTVLNPNAVADFENLNAPSLQWAQPAKPVGAEWTYFKKLTGAGSIDGFMSVETKKGTSLKFESNSGTSINPYLEASYSSSETVYSNGKDCISGKVSVQVSDKAAAKIIMLKTDQNKQINAVLFEIGGKLYVFGNEICEYAFNHWYDIEFTYSAEDGKYSYKVEDGSNIYRDSGVFEQTGGFPQKIWKLAFQLNNQKPKTDNTYFIIDAFSMTESTMEKSFKIDKDSSAGNYVVTQTGDVLVSFTNKLDREQSLEGKVSCNNSVIANVSFVDDYTIKVEMDKEADATYHIDFNNITDVFGCRCTDFVKFTVLKPDLDMTDVVFTDADNNLLSLLKPGTVSASFRAKANNNKTFEINYILALFDGNRLADVESKIVTVDSLEDNYDISLTVPQEGAYILKVFRLDKDLQTPYAKPNVLKPTPDGKPVAIVKLDDVQVFADNYMDSFESIANWTYNNNIKMSAGLIVSSLDNPQTTPDKLTRFTDMAAMSNVEIWFHGYENPPSANLTYRRTKDEQKIDFDNGIATAARIGLTFTAFNPPSNAMNTDTVDLINEFYPNFTTVMTLTTGGGYGLQLNGANELFRNIQVEPSATSETDTVENLKTKWNEKAANSDYLILQVHPGAWANYEGSADRFKEF